MNSPKVAVPLGLILIFSVLFTACGGGGGKSKAPPPGNPIIQTVLLPQGAVGVPYGVFGAGAVLSATGGTGTYTWSIVSGSLPPGLALDPMSGIISGTPTTLGNYVFTVQVTDQASLSYRQQLSIYVQGVVSITPAVLPSGAANVAYPPVQLVATGGLPPYVWCVVESSGTCDQGNGGALPPGLSLSSDGIISGTPTTDGTPTTFTAKVMDSESAPGVPAVGTGNFTITIMSIVTTSLPAGYLNTAYSSTLTVAGGLLPYTWSIVSGSLPPGLSLDPASCTASKGANCKITGTPTKIGAYPITFEVTDGEKSNPAVAMASLTLNVFQTQLTITTTSLPPGIVGIAYNTTLQATGGTPPYTWSISSGTLPPGLALNGSTGVISGTPTTTGSYGLTLQVQDTSNPPQTASGTFAILINPAITDSALSGNYVFTFSGFNSGTPVMMAGSFVADGNGNFTSGVLDYNAGAGESPDNNPTPQTITPGPGSVYNITPNGLGTMTLTTSLTVFQFAIVVKGNGSGGRLIQSDPANPQAYGSGAIMSTTPLGPGETFPLCGSHIALGFFGFDNTLITRYAGAGVFQFDPTTCVDAENGMLDTDDGGTVTPTTFTGAFNQLDLNTSRGIAGLTLSPGGRHFYAFYLVSSSDRKTNQLVWIATEAASQPAALTQWSALQQANPPTGWNNSNLAGISVAELNALDTNGAVDVTAGLFTGSGTSGNNCQNNTYDNATFSYDENQGGNSSLQQTSTGTYCVDKITGRVTLTAFNAGPFATPPVFYLVKTDQAFAVGTDPAVTSGILEQQATGSPFNNGSVSGPYVGGTVTPIATNVTNAVSWLFADGGGNINGTGNTSGPAGPGTQNFTYTYSVDGTGRVVVQNGGSTIGILYVVSPQKFVMLPTTDPNPALSVFNQ